MRRKEADVQPLKPSFESCRSRIDPILLQWFQQQWPQLTQTQQLAWPIVLRGDHVLIAAPTGTGKTLAALIPLWQRLHCNPTHDDRAQRTIQGLIISPLKALCHDLFIKLERYRAELQRMDPTRTWPVTGCRTGDTPRSSRHDLRKKPPDWLITTPESLSLMLAHPASRAILTDIKAVIVDEVHALAPTKRGVELTVALERLEAIVSHSIQRIGLSATCSPRNVVANWLGGMHRSVEQVVLPDDRPWELNILHVAAAAQEGQFLISLFPYLKPTLETNGTTLLFCDARSVAERLAWYLKRQCPDHADSIAVHHGALAQTIRSSVEQRIQSGQLRLVICSPSLELGVDLGHVDQVMMIRPPGGAARLLQRLGRASHRPDGIRRGVIITTNQEELWEAVTTRDAGQQAWLEPVEIPNKPLDVLCQQLMALGIEQTFTAPAALQLLRQTYPYRELTIAELTSCLTFLTGGRNADEYPPRLRFDRNGFKVASERMTRIYRQNAGSIQSESTCLCRLPDGAPVGQLNSIYADKLDVGDRFSLGAQNYELRSRHAGQLVVVPAIGVPRFPRWQGGFSLLPNTLAERWWHLRNILAESLQEGWQHALQQTMTELHLPEPIAKQLLAQLAEQIKESEIPQDDLLIESWPSQCGETLWHALHLPLSKAPADAVGRVVSWRLTNRMDGIVLPGSLMVILRTASTVEVTPERWRTLLQAQHWDKDVLRVIKQHTALRTHFDQVARNGLMLLKNPTGPRPRVGGSQWSGDRLLRWLQFVQPEFPLVRQAVLEVRDQMFATQAVLEWLQRLQRRVIRQRWLNKPSPLVRSWFDEDGLSQASASLEATLLHLHQQQTVIHAAS